MKATLLLSLLLVVTAVSRPVEAVDLSPMEELGKAIFFDENLSIPPGLSCAGCHAPETGFTGPVSAINAMHGVYPGAVHRRFGNRKPPTTAYAGDSPVLFFDEEEGLWIGGMFWDGRATGWELGDPLAEQAMGPFLNKLEQNIPWAKLVVRRVALSGYRPLFEEVWGETDWKGWRDTDQTYELIARSIAAYERSLEVSAFSSKYDSYLAGDADLDPEELRGLELFNGKAMCSACHPSEPGANGEPPLFTDFTYDNLGIPKNPSNPFYRAPTSVNPDGEEWVDPGLAGFLASQGYEEDEWMAELGKHKVPTLRNVDKRPYDGFIKAFGHNGYFVSLAEIVHFYNTRDLEEVDWPDPEVAVNVNTDELGNLGLTPDEEADLVAFMKTLSDGYQPSDTGNGGWGPPPPLNPQPGSPAFRKARAAARANVHKITGARGNRRTVLPKASNSGRGNPVR